MATTATPATGINTASSTRGRFIWHELVTTDPAAADKFYKEVIGWGSTKSGMEGMDYTMFTVGEMPVSGFMGLTPDMKARGVPPHWLAYTEVPDCDATVAQVQQLGGKVLLAPMSVPNVGRFSVLKDPQGAVFGIIASARPLGEEQDPAPKTYSWHELATPNLAAGISFYEQIFGWKKQSEFDMGPEMGVYHMFGRDRFTYGGMMKLPPDVPEPYWLHYVSVDSADAATERATKAGAKIAMGPMEVPGGDRVAVLIDPQGAYFAVHSKAPVAK
jgi:predicted enzyme related to lactoylglutathione lyase